MNSNNKTMKAVIVEKPNGDFIIKEVPIPEPKSGQALVKIEGAPINPTDILTIKGAKPLQFPVQVGQEGVGTVIKVGDSSKENLIGKRIAFSSITPGAWAEYALIESDLLFEIDKNLELEKGATAYLNPLTSLGLADLIQKGGHKAVVITTASACSKILFKLFQEVNIKTIAVVRKEEQKKICLDSGATIALNSNDPDFEETLKKYAHELNATGLIECILGDTLNKIQRNLPRRSVTIYYGRLSDDKNVSYDAMEALFHERTITGYIYLFWFNDLEEKRKQELIKKINSNLDTTFKTDISKVFKLENIKEAYDFYLKNMSNGKVILTP